MASPPGPLGSDTNSGLIDCGTSARTQNRPPGVVCSSRPSETDVDARAQHAASAVLSMDTPNAQAAVWLLLGRESFTAGVIAGMVKSLAVSVFELAKLYQMFALAEYWESKHNHSFWMRMREAALMTNPIGQSINNLKTGFAVASHFWPDFDKLAHKAYDDRQALFEGLEYAFTHIGEVFGTIPKSLEEKWRTFRAYIEARTLKGNFLAGVMVGEILLDVLLLIDVATGVVVLIRAVPKLGRMVVDLARLAKALKGAPKGGGGAPKVATEALEGTTHSIFDAGRGTPPKSMEPPKPTKEAEVAPRGERRPLFDNPSKVVKDRVEELKEAIPENSRGRITMGVAVAEDASGGRSVLISTSEPRGYLRP